MPKIIYTRLLFFADGFTPLPSLIFMKPSWRGHEGLLQHELVHTRQMAKEGVITFWLKYLLSRRSRMAYEVEAYKTSLKYSPWNVDVYANMLASSYFLGISHEQAKAELLA